MIMLMIVKNMKFQKINCRSPIDQNPSAKHNGKPQHRVFRMRCREKRAAPTLNETDQEQR